VRRILCDKTDVWSQSTHVVIIFNFKDAHSTHVLIIFNLRDLRMCNIDFQEDTNYFIWHKIFYSVGITSIINMCIRFHSIGNYSFNHSNNAYHSNIFSYFHLVLFNNFCYCVFNYHIFNYLKKILWTIISYFLYC